MKSYLSIVSVISFICAPHCIGKSPQAFNAEDIQSNPEFRKYTGKQKFSGDDVPQQPSRILPYSDAFPEYITPELIQLALKHNPEIAMHLKFINTQEQNQLVRAYEILLVGETGVGKTAFAAVLALASQGKITYIQATNLAGDRSQNSGIRAINEKLGVILQDMKTCDDSYVVVLDELAALTGKIEGNAYQAQTAAHLSAMLDRLRATNRVSVVATAISLDDLSPAMKSRFKSNTIVIPRPNKEFREHLIAHMLVGSHDFSPGELDDLAKRADGLTIRTLNHAVRKAAQIAALRSQPVVVGYHDMCKALEEYTTAYAMRAQEVMYEAGRFFKDNAMIIFAVASLFHCGAIVIGPVAKFVLDAVYKDRHDNDINS